MNNPIDKIAPELETLTWLNSNQPLSLQMLRGQVVVIHAFQMLCPGCVIHGVPQANSIYELYRDQDVQLIGLHTVFEHHDVMTQAALAAFIHEYRIPFPVAIDRPSSNGPIPVTMSRYQMQGTPSLIVIDKNGYLRLNYFGRMSDMQIGSIIGSLLEQPGPTHNKTSKLESKHKTIDTECDENSCAL